MNELLDITKLRILQCLLHSDLKDCTVTVIARTLKLEKYAVSRILSTLEKEGIVCRTEKRKILLTDHGSELAERYAKRMEAAVNHLIYEGVDMDSARNDALHWALYNSESTMEMIHASSELYRVKVFMRGQKSFGGAAFCKNMQDGVYQFPFILYRECVQNGNNLSMANQGFLNPCTLRVENGVGTIQLCAVDMIGKSRKSGAPIRARVRNLQYFEYGEFSKAEVSGNILSFSASALQFVSVGTGVSQILHGSVLLRMECSSGLSDMPESKAIFTMLV